MPRLRMKSGSSRKTTAAATTPTEVITVSTTSSRVKAPPHPFPELQGPFEESMTELERIEETEVPSDAASRRTILLDAPTYQRVIAGRWKQRPREKYHPLWKIIAQLSFGLHLLAENLAKSDEEVMQILQGHIDEIDLFLERTTEDFALAQDDIRERMRCLQLPLQHPKVFDRMLEDRTFRNSIVDGNEKIEHIVSRTGFAMKDALKDAQKGLDATNALAQYLDTLENSWTRQNSDHQAVFEAMLENVEGWRGAFIDLRENGDKLGQVLQQLSEVINQMQQRAGEVSRRLIQAQAKQGVSPTASNNITYIPRQSMSSAGGSRAETPDQPPRKPLPGVPNRHSGRQLTTPNQRCETAQSTRSATSYLSSNMQNSRVSSRTGQYSSTRDSSHTGLSAKSPRLVEIKRHSPQGLDVAHAAATHQSLGSRPNSRPALAAELPAEASCSTSQTARASATSGFNAGLGIMQTGELNQSPGQLQDQVSNTATAPASDALGSSRLPLTPNSMISNGDHAHILARELSPDVAARPTLVSALPRAAADSSLGSPPSTPGWAKQTFDMSERERMVVDKTAFRSHPPNADFGSPPVLFPTRFNSQAHHARVNGSVASSIGAPGPEVASSPVKSVKSINQNDNAMRGPPPGSAIAARNPTPGVQTGTGSGKKEFIAELEGTTPLTIRSTVNTTEPVRKTAREVTHEVLELEVPLPPPSAAPVISEVAHLSDSRQGLDSAPVSAEARGDLDILEHRVAAHIRKSFIATNIELPGESIDGTYIKNNNAGLPPILEGEQFPQSGEDSQEGVGELLVQFKQSDSKPLNLNLRGQEELLVLLPATTYVAERSPISRSRSPVSPVSQQATTKAAKPESRSPATVSNGGTPLSQNGIFRRDSSGSTASSQSQWRAFFKGQLSPAEFNSSTPHLLSKPNSAHKAIVELQRRGQEASPTLGWQWAPETPEIERSGLRRVDT